LQCPQWRWLGCSRRGVCRFRPSRRGHGCSPGWRPDFWQPTPLGIEGPWRFFFQLDGDEGWLDDRTPSTSARSSLLLLARLLFEEFAGTPYAEYFATGDS